MKVLELYNGCESLGSVFIELGFDVVSFSLESFNINSYPIESNCFDIVFININDSSLDYGEGLDDDCLMVGMDCIEYFNLKFWIILHNGITIKEDLIMWGLPYRDIDFISAGQQIKTRVWNNIFKWRPRFSNVYILQKTILLELLSCVQVSSVCSVKNKNVHAPNFKTKMFL